MAEGDPRRYTVVVASSPLASAIRRETLMRLLLGTLVLAAALSAQSTNAPSDAVRSIVGRLELERYKAHIKGLSQFGDRMQGTEPNRDAIDWL